LVADVGQGGANEAVIVSRGSTLKVVSIGEQGLNVSQLERNNVIESEALAWSGTAGRPRLVLAERIEGGRRLVAYTLDGLRGLAVDWQIALPATVRAVKTGDLRGRMQKELILVNAVNGLNQVMVVQPDPQGGGLATLQTSEGFAGAVTGLQVADVDGDGTSEVIIQAAIDGELPQLRALTWQPAR
jgi:hypothetical protein